MSYSAASRTVTVTPAARLAFNTTYTVTVKGGPAGVADVLGNRTPRGTVRQQFTISSLADQWMPAAFRPVATTVGNARVIPDSSTLIAPAAEILPPRCPLVFLRGCIILESKTKRI